eukprot:TRINITY_DN327_c0_g1_i1.p1 TRINITY_DN327_c0_g1~~TRINITY_DN327_c0_g1_i1.p1  ORF type:complete len:655 (+),score=217.19 TRINITY_DN327_c0_g1_i1:43-2007(+)
MGDPEIPEDLTGLLKELERENAMLRKLYEKALKELEAALANKNKLEKEKERPATGGEDQTELLNQLQDHIAELEHARDMALVDKKIMEAEKEPAKPMEIDRHLLEQETERLENAANVIEDLREQAASNVLDSEEFEQALMDIEEELKEAEKAMLKKDARIRVLEDRLKAMQQVRRKEPAKKIKALDTSIIGNMSNYILALLKDGDLDLGALLKLIDALQTLIEHARDCHIEANVMQPKLKIVRRTVEEFDPMEKMNDAITEDDDLQEARDLVHEAEQRIHGLREQIRNAKHLPKTDVVLSQALGNMEQALIVIDKLKKGLQAMDRSKDNRVALKELVGELDKVENSLLGKDNLIHTLQAQVDVLEDRNDMLEVAMTMGDAPPDVQPNVENAMERIHVMKESPTLAPEDMDRLLGEVEHELAACELELGKRDQMIEKLKNRITMLKKKPVTQPDIEQSHYDPQEVKRVTATLKDLQEELEFGTAVDPRRLENALGQAMVDLNEMGATIRAKNAEITELHLQNEANKNELKSNDDKIKIMEKHSGLAPQMLSDHTGKLAAAKEHIRFLLEDEDDDEEDDDGVYMDGGDAMAAGGKKQPLRTGRPIKDNEKPLIGNTQQQLAVVGQRGSAVVPSAISLMRILKQPANPTNLQPYQSR